MPKYFGAHVSAAGGLQNALIAAKELGINTIQIHPSPPQRWNTTEVPEEAEREFHELRATSGLDHLFFHGIYLINLATPDDQKFKLAQISLGNYLKLADRLKCSGVIFHLGSMKDQEDESIGYDRVVAGINAILEKTPGKSRLILEVAAGAGAIIGDRLEELAMIYSQVEQKDRVGFGLDSQHMWASGYDFKNSLAEIVRDIENILGLDKVWSIHLNDSLTALGSRKDRHANIGEGLIGEEAMKAFFLHPKLSHIPYILETPALKNIEGAHTEIEKLRGFLKK